MPEVIPISAPQFGLEAEELVLQAIRSGRVAQGPLVEQFESQCAQMAGVNHAIAVSNGTVSLEAALAVLGVGPGDEVITTPFTFAATLNSVLTTGATVRFADIRDDFTIDPESIRALINSKTKALIPVHLYGLCADMDAISEIARSHSLAIVEDAAQAHGARIADKAAGSWGVGSFSFYATKNIAAGEGGCLTTNDDELAQKFRIYRNQGMAQRYQYVMVGRNLRMTELQAALAIPQMRQLEQINAQRNQNATKLNALLDSTPRVTTPTIPQGRTHVWHQYTILLDEGLDRHKAVDMLGELGVIAGIYYPGLAWRHQPYELSDLVIKDETPKAEDISNRCLSLPVHQHLTADQVERVAEAVTEVVAKL